MCLSTLRMGTFMFKFVIVAVAVVGGNDNSNNVLNLI